MDLSLWLSTLWSELVRAGNIPSRLRGAFSSSLTDAYEPLSLTSLITVPAVVTAATCLTSPASDLKEVNKTAESHSDWPQSPSVHMFNLKYFWDINTFFDVRCLSNNFQDKDKNNSESFRLYVYVLWYLRRPISTYLCGIFVRLCAKQRDFMHHIPGCLELIATGDNNLNLY